MTRFQTAQGRIQHMEEVDGMVASWIAAQDLDEVLAKFEEAEAAIGPLTISNRSLDPQYVARNDIVTVADEELGEVRMVPSRSCRDTRPRASRWPRMGSTT